MSQRASKEAKPENEPSAVMTRLSWQLALRDDAQVAQGLYGSFVIEPSNASWDVEYTEIVNDGALGYTINGKGWPATTPLVARLGQRVLVRLANVGQMLQQPWNQPLVGFEGRAP